MVRCAPETSPKARSRHGPESGAQADQFQNFFLDRYAAAYKLEMAHFADMIAHAAPPEISYRDGVAALVLATAAQKSMQAGAPVQI
jgi:myo-inositol 2-dehydrogenase/D-chiro-inositol 1-dehydrogenase